MNLDNFNNLIELFFYQEEKQDNKSVFLQWLNPNNKKTFTWEETKLNIFKLSKIIRENIKEGDRCLLVSENRPEWFVSDLAIMLSGGITVPAYTTYTEGDYKYLIEYKGRMAELVDAHDSKSCFVRSESSILSSPTRSL